MLLGGQEYDWKIGKAKDPYDLVVLYEGEETFAEILEENTKDRNFNTIGNILTREGFTFSKKPMDISNLHSPWIVEQDNLKRLSEDIQKSNRKPRMIWETNRGCPYRCTFCDWGSATNSKIRKFDTTRLENEIKVFHKFKPGFMFIADANFGIFKTDVNLAEKLCEAKKENSYPMTVSFNPAKNNKKFVNKINDVFFDNEMIHCIQISFQHTDEHVLSAIERSNIKTEKILEELEDNYKKRIPLVGVLIQSCPGDTLSKWKKSVTDLMEWGFHEDIKCHDFQVLPNAPASHKSYREKWGIETVIRPHFDTVRLINDSEELNKAEFIVATNTFTKEDWKKMKSWSEIVQTLHYNSLTKFIALYLRYYHNVSFLDFYSGLISTNLLQLDREIQEHLNLYLSDDTKEQFIVYKDFKYQLSLSSFAYVKISEDLNLFYNELFNYCRKFNINENILKDLIKFQRNIIITKDYRSKFNVSLSFNWFEVFNRILTCNPTKIQESLENIRYIPKTYKLNYKYGGIYLNKELSFDNFEDFYIKMLAKANFRTKNLYLWKALNDYSN